MPLKRQNKLLCFIEVFLLIMKKNIKIHGSLKSANFRKVVAVARYLGIEYSHASNDVYKGEGQTESYLSINKLGQIPTLVVDNDIITESNAIIIYLSEYSRTNELYASNPSSQAAINQWLFWESSQWQPVLSKVMGTHVGHKLLPSVLPAPTSPVDWDSPDCMKQMSYLESSLKNDWLTGANISLADFSIAAMTTYFKVCEFPFHAYPNINRWYVAMNDLQSWKSTESQIWSC